MDASYIQLSGLEHVYREGGAEQPVLRGLDLVLRKGETVALLGRSGSGKSTLLNLLSGIDLPERGEVRVGGIELSGLTERERTLFRRRHIGFIYQFFNLIPTLTALENVAFMLELNGAGARVSQARAEGLLARLGLQGKEARFPSRLSGGEQQRVAIARALAHSPALVLADEPTGNLDAKSGAAALALLHELLAETGGTLLLVTHSLSVARSCGRVLTLVDGRLEERGHDFAW
jgi:putative ABC transport system ATP-binding protein